MSTWADDAAAALDDLGDSPTPVQARAVTDRYPNVDVLAALASRGGGGASGGPTLIGPFTFHYNDAGIAEDGVLLTELDAGTIVLAVYVVVVTAWDGGTVTAGINLGGEDWAPPDDDYIGIADVQIDQATSVNGARGFGVHHGAATAEDVILKPEGGVLTTAGALVAYIPGGTPTQGEAQLYALVVAP